jgi:hypothetical protein
MSYVITPLPTSVAEEARSASHDAYGNRLHPEVQTSAGAPCRHCLRRANTGETMLLFAYSPFEKRNPYKEVGPIFVHANGCERYTETGRIPDDFLNRPIVLRAYDASQSIATSTVVVDGKTERHLEELLADPKVEHVQARSITHGCYLFRIDRSPNLSS